MQRPIRAMALSKNVGRVGFPPYELRRQEHAQTHNTLKKGQYPRQRVEKLLRDYHRSSIDPTEVAAALTQTLLPYVIYAIAF
jgi:hypothetical protein